MPDRARDEPVSNELEVRTRARGRALLVCGNVLYADRNYAIVASSDGGLTWSRVTALPLSPLRRLARISRLACRALRIEIRALARLGDHEFVASNREGIFFGRLGDAVMRPCALDGGDVPFYPPMRIGVGPGEVAVFGEYALREDHPVRLFASRDRGESFEILHTFERGSLRHVHNVIWDGQQAHYWVLAGDYGEHPGIGRLSQDLERFEWLVKGDQRYRVVEVFDQGERLLYATDTEIETNGLMSLDKRTGAVERLRDFSGSCIHACRFGEWLALTTTVEPSSVNRTQHSELWLSRDGERWHCVLRARKDRWHPRVFRYGSLVLPTGHGDDDRLWVSGQAVEGFDGEVVCAHAPGWDA